VAENVQATAYLTIDELSSIIEGPLVNGSTHGDINSKTDIIIFGELDREKDWHEGKKHLKILKELSGPRKKPLLFIHFKDFMNINENIANGCKGMSCVDSRARSLLPQDLFARAASALATRSYLQEAF